MYNNYNDENPGYYRNINPVPQDVNVGPIVRRPVKKHKKGAIALVMLTVALVSGVIGGGAGWMVAQKTIAGNSAVNMSTVQEGTDDSTMLLSNNTTANEENGTGTTSEATGGSVTDVAGKVGASVVEISTESLSVNPFIGEAVSEGGGSGVVFSDDGYIMTNNHVVEGANNIIVTLADGTEYPAQLVGRDAETDLAVVKIDATGLTLVEFADSSTLQVGELAIAIGNPLGELGGTVTSGIVSATTRDITIDNEVMSLIQTSAAVNPGNSGGGLFNGDGKLIGIVNAKLSGSEIEGLAFAIPSNTVIDIINEIVENGYVTGRTQLGIEVLDVSDSDTAARYGLNNYGAFVAVSNDMLGVKAADKIVSIDGTTIASTVDINAVLDNYEVGDTVQLQIERDGQIMQINVPVVEQLLNVNTPSGVQNNEFVTV